MAVTFRSLISSLYLLTITLTVPILSQNSSDSVETDSTLHTTSVDHSTLRSVILIFNQGLSAPPSTYAHADPHLRPELWFEGAGQLTTASKSRWFNSGKTFRSRYHRLLTDSPRDVYARSGDREANIEGALVFLHGAYKAVGDWKYGSTDYLPIPVHTVPTADDCVLSIHCNCPKVNDVIKEFLSSSECDELKKEFAATLKLVESNTGLTSLWNQIDYVETMLFMMMMDAKIPSWITEGVREDLNDLANKFHSMATAYPDMLKVMSSPIYTELTDKLKSIITPTPQSSDKIKPRLLLYSTQTPIMSSVAYHLGGVNGEIPPPGSIFIIELYEEPGLTYSIKMFYWNDTNTHQSNPVYPTFSTSSQSQSTASLNDLFDHMSTLMEPDWPSYCGLSSSTDSGIDSLSLILIIILCIVFASVAFTIIMIVKKSRSGYVIFK